MENDLKKNTMRSKKNKATNMETLPNKNLRETHVPYFKKKILEDEDLTATSMNGYKWRGKLRDTYAWIFSVFDWSSTKQ